MTKSALGFLLLLSAIVVAPESGSAACHPASVEMVTAVQAIRSACDCSGATSRALYLDCARNVIATEIAEARLSRACRAQVQRFAAASTCGRPGRVACCVHADGRPWKGSIRRDTAACRAPRGGSACVSPLPHLADACDSDLGCLDGYCGDGRLDASRGEECEPPGSASCDLQCRFDFPCGNGVIEPGEECDGQPGCDRCFLRREMCCQIGEACLGSSVGSAGSFSATCTLVLSGAPSSGVCEGAGPCLPSPNGVYSCEIGTCGDPPIDPLPLCCQHANGSCTATIATTAGAAGSFGCDGLFPPYEGGIDRLVVGTCGADGRCVPAN